MKALIIAGILILLCIVSIVFLFDVGRTHVPAIVVANFAECAEHYPVMESYPRRCQTPEGQSFTEEIKENENESTTTPSHDLTKPLRFTNLKPGQTVASPLTIKGEAPGTWFFEASFPVSILDERGNKLVTVPAQAKGEWMTTAYVPFEVTLTFDAGTSTEGTIHFENDNPSGLPENSRSVTVPVTF